MMEKSKLRGADVVTGLIMILFGIWELSETFRMPMKDSFGGVMNVWYVSPALFPMIIGFAMILLAGVIIRQGIKEGGLAYLKSYFAQRRGGISESTIRFAAILLPLLSLVFMNLTRIDFFLSLTLFLAFIIPVFYFDDMRLLKRIMAFYAVEMALLLILFVTGLDKALNGAFRYAVDVLALVMLVALILFVRASIKGDAVKGKMLSQSLLMSFVPPLVLVPTFRFFLRVPLPKEGGIMDLMYLVYYMFR